MAEEKPAKPNRKNPAEEIVEAVETAVSETADAAQAAAAEVAETVKSTAKEVAKTTRKSAEKVVSTAKKGATKATKSAEKGVSKTTATAKKAARKVEEAVDEATEGAVGRLGKSFDEFMDHQRKAVEEAGKALESLIPEGVRTHGRSAIEEAIEGYRKLVNSVVDQLNDTLKRVVPGGDGKEEAKEEAEG